MSIEIVAFTFAIPRGREHPLVFFFRFEANTNRSARTQECHPKIVRTDGRSREVLPSSTVISEVSEVKSIKKEEERRKAKVKQCGVQFCLCFGTFIFTAIDRCI
ncbi:2,3-bisphosphoglycerate-independent phosphoglycerate mutase [Dirofilaria immitis]